MRCPSDGSPQRFLRPDHEWRLLSSAPVSRSAALSNARRDGCCSDHKLRFGVLLARHTAANRTTQNAGGELASELPPRRFEKTLTRSNREFHSAKNSNRTEGCFLKTLAISIAYGWRTKRDSNWWSGWADFAFEMSEEFRAKSRKLQSEKKYGHCCDEWLIRQAAVPARSRPTDVANDRNCRAGVSTRSAASFGLTS